MPVPEDGSASLAVDAFLHRNTAPCAYPCDGEDVDDEEEEAQQQTQRPPPHGVFHAHAHDMAYLEEWIGEILNVTRDEDDGKGKGAPGGLSRYDQGLGLRGMAGKAN